MSENPNLQIIQILFAPYNCDGVMAAKQAQEIIARARSGQQNVRDYMRLKLGLTTPVVDAVCRVLFRDAA